MRLQSGVSQKLFGDPNELEKMLMNSLALTKSGDDSIFAWHHACETARKEGKDVINATLGSMLDDDGILSVNKVVKEILKEQDGHDYSAYAPLKGIDEFRNIAIEQVLGPSMLNLSLEGMHICSVATPGGCGALYASANIFATPNSKVLLRDQHWMPYETILTENNLKWKNWNSYGTYGKNGEGLMIDSFNFELKILSKEQERTLIWLNDPAHNPTGRTFTPKARMDLLESIVNNASENPNKGYTFLVDSAYSSYSNERYGWSETISTWIKKNKIDYWPDNLLICFAYSASKSHTIYGLRLGALVVIHPNKILMERMEEVLLHTGRGTWSAAPRLPQIALTKIHTNSSIEKKWDIERIRMKSLLDDRRETFVKMAEESNLPIYQTDEGYFAFVQCDKPQVIAEKCAEMGVFVVPLSGGIRIGICAVPESKMHKIVDVLSQVIVR